VAQQCKKILHMIGGGEIGGAEELVFTLLKQTDPSRYEVHLVCLCPGPFADLVAREGFPTLTIPMRNRMDLSKIKAVRNYINEHQIDLVHTHGVRANLIGRPAARRENIPIVTTFHSMLRYDYDAPWKVAMAQFLTRAGNHYTNRFIAISHAIKEDLLAMHIPANKIQVIHSGLDVSKFTSQQKPDEIRRQFNLDSDRLTFTMVARFHPVKGHRYFLQAARQLLDAGIKAQFLFIGEGFYRPEVEAQVKNLGLDSVVHMPGYYRQVEDVYRVSDVICVPSLMEGLGLVILEGMYFGVPVIASSVGGILELIEDGKSGILIPPADTEALYKAMYKLAVDQDLAQALAQEGKERVKQFTIENMTRQVEECYSELLKNS
jgi:glycosyltransferase involved in cell wall biosynthesis